MELLCFPRKTKKTKPFWLQAISYGAAKDGYYFYYSYQTVESPAKKNKNKNRPGILKVHIEMF